MLKVASEIWWEPTFEAGPCFQQFATHSQNRSKARCTTDPSTSPGVNPPKVSSPASTWPVSRRCSHPTPNPNRSSAEGGCLCRHHWAHHWGPKRFLLRLPSQSNRSSPKRPIELESMQELREKPKARHPHKGPGTSSFAMLQKCSHAPTWMWVMFLIEALSHDITRVRLDAIVRGKPSREGSCKVRPSDCYKLNAAGDLPPPPFPRFQEASKV